MNDINKFILLKQIATQGPVSRIELTKRTDLSKMTVTAIVNEFISKGVVRECGASYSTGGRRPILLEIVPNSMLTLGISIGRDILQAGIINLRGEILQSETLPMAPIRNSEALLKSIFNLCDHLIKNKLSGNILGIGVSSVGPLSVGTILNPPDFNNLHNIPVTSELNKRYGLPVFMQNDMYVAALAEVYFGDMQDLNSFIYIGISSGIGGGIILNRKLYTGISGLAGTIGHSIVVPGGIQCECGRRGCLEKYSSTRATLHWAKENGAGDNITWWDLADGAVNGNPLYMQAIDRMTQYLVTAIINFQAAFDIECFVIGGDLYMCKDMIVESIRSKLRSQRTIWDQQNEITIRPSSFASSAPFIGTAALVMENRLEPMP